MGETGEEKHGQRYDGSVGDGGSQGRPDAGPAALAERFGDDQCEEGARCEAGRQAEDETLKEYGNHGVRGGATVPATDAMVFMGELYHGDSACGGARGYHPCVQVVEMYRQYR